MKPVIALIAASLVAAHGLVWAEGARSLNDARSQINTGTWPGITIFDFKKKPEPPAAAASGAGAKPSGPAASVPTVAPATSKGASAPASSNALQSAVERVSARITNPEPPSNQPMNAAKRLDSPELGIPLPTAATFAKPASAPKP